MVVGFKLLKFKRAGFQILVRGGIAFPLFKLGVGFKSHMVNVVHEMLLCCVSAFLNLAGSINSCG